MSWHTVNRGCLIALSVFSIVDNVEIDIRAAKKVEPILADVMKNITRVNNMLRDLIRNYEKLEKISKTESVESDTDTDVGELFNDKKKTRNRVDSKSTPKAEIQKAYATAMFFDENESNDNNSNSQDTKTDDNSLETIKENEQRENENQQQRDNENEKGKHSEEKQQKVKGVESKVESKAKDSAAVVPAIDALKEFIKTFSDESESNEAKDKNDSETLTNSLATFSTTPISPGLFKFKHQIQPLPKEKKYLEPRIENYETPTIVRRVRNENDDEKILIGKAEKISNVERKKEAKSNTTVIDVIKDIKKQLESSPLTDMMESSDDIKTIQKEELNTNVLREAYGDACLKLVVRKCYMACKATIKEVCSRKSECSKSFRDKFKKNAIPECKKQFGRNDKQYRMSEGRNGEGELQDMTRAGYFSMACLPAKSTRTKKLPDEKPADLKPGVTIEPIVKTLNILRDKYETACQEESMRKCYKACTNAAKQACKDGGKCSDRRLKKFGSTCKKRCKQNYNPRAKRGSHSSSSSDSSEDSDKSKDVSWNSKN